MNIRKIIITEKQFLNNFNNGCLITENRASKNQSLARKMVRSINPSLDDKEFVETVLHDIPNVRKADFHLYPAVVRFVLEAGNRLDASTIQELNRYLGSVAENAKKQGYDQNLNGMSLQEFFDKFRNDVNNKIQKDKDESSTYGEGDGNYNGYDIVFIPDFETSSQYKDYTSWCITSNADMFERYTNYGTGYFYFLLKDGFENVSREKGSNCPLDEYGLSMIAVSFRADNSINTVTCRWNHDNGGDDSIMSPNQLSKLIGADIFSVCKDTRNNLPEGITPFRSTSDGLTIYRDDNRDDYFVTDSIDSYPLYFNKNDYVMSIGEDSITKYPSIILLNGKVISLQHHQFKQYFKIDNKIYLSSYWDRIKEVETVDLNTGKIELDKTFKDMKVLNQNFVAFTTSDNHQFLYNAETKQTTIDEKWDEIYGMTNYYDCLVRKDDKYSIFKAQDWGYAIPWCINIVHYGNLFLLENQNGKKYLCNSNGGLDDFNYDDIKLIQKPNSFREYIFVAQKGNSYYIIDIDDSDIPYSEELDYDIEEDREIINSFNNN